MASFSLDLLYTLLSPQGGIWAVWMPFASVQFSMWLVHRGHLTDTLKLPLSQIIWNKAKNSKMNPRFFSRAWLLETPHVWSLMVKESERNLAWDPLKYRIIAPCIYIYIYQAFKTIIMKWGTPICVVTQCPLLFYQHCQGTAYPQFADPSAPPTNLRNNSQLRCPSCFKRCKRWCPRTVGSLGPPPSGRTGRWWTLISDEGGGIQALRWTSIAMENHNG